VAWCARVGRHGGRPSRDGRPLASECDAYYNPTMLNRKTPHHGPTPPLGNVCEIQFLTVCTRNRQRILGSDHAHELLLSSWARTNDWLVGRYVVMPDHVHLFCCPTASDPRSIELWVRHWKTQFARGFRAKADPPIWQRSHWDTRMRTTDQYLAKWEYVRLNPVRASLASVPEEWHWAGEIHLLRW